MTLQVFKRHIDNICNQMYMIITIYDEQIEDEFLIEFDELPSQQITTYH